MPTSIEREVFPGMAADSQLHCFDLRGFWMDVGQPKDYLTGIGLFLDSLSRHANDLDANGDPVELAEEDRLAQPAPHIRGNVLIHPSAVIGAGCIIGPNVTIGPNVHIAEGVRITRSAIFEGAHIGSHTWIHSSIIGWNAVIGKWVRIEGTTVLGDDVTVKDELLINGALVLPNKTLSSSVSSPQIIM